MELRPINGRIRIVPAPAANQAIPIQLPMANQLNGNPPLGNDGGQVPGEQGNGGQPPGQPGNGGNPPIQANVDRGERITFKEIKQATEALQATVPKFTGENPDELFGTWVQRFTIEANTLKLSREMIATVFPRLLDGKARLKYQSLTAPEKANFGMGAVALGNKLRTQGGRSKAMNDLAKIKKKGSESMIVFSKRVEGQVNVAYPRLLMSQKEEIAINRFIQGTPPRIRTKLMEVQEEFENLSQAVRKAEQLEELLEEEEKETVNLINQVTKSDFENECEKLRKKVDDLTLKNNQMMTAMKSQRNNKFVPYNNMGQNGNQPQQFFKHAGTKPFFQKYQPGPNSPRRGGYQGNQNNYRDRNSRSNYQNTPSGPRGRSCPPQREGWQINRSPRGSGINFLMLVAICGMLAQTATANMQICPNERSGEYFYPPTTIPCEIDKTETVVKTEVEIWTEYGNSQKATAYRCALTTYNTCYMGFLDFVMVKPTVLNVETKPMTKEDCESAIHGHKVKGIVLEPKGENLFQSTPEEGFTIIGKNDVCPEKSIYTMEVGEIATPDGETTASSLGDTSGCKAQNGDCEITDARITWDSTGIKEFCKYSLITTAEAYVTKTKIAIPELQMALQIAQKQETINFEMCAPTLAVSTNNGFLVTFKNTNHTETLEELITKVKRRRVRRSILKNKPQDQLIQRIFGPNANIQNYTKFAVDPPNEYRLIYELRKYDVTFAQQKYQWENYDVPNKQIATLRAIREAELRKQYIRELRQGGEGERQADLIKRLEQPTDIFDQDLVEEFGPARKLLESEKRDWNEKGTLDNLLEQKERVKAGQQYVQTISQQSAKASENRENAQINSRVQFVADKIIEANHQEFNNVYRKLCELQNTQIEITKTLLTIDPTLGMRTLLRRNDIVAKRAGEVYMVNQCREVTVDKIHYDHKVNGKCFVDTPVTVKNQTWFIAPGTQRDLIQESQAIACEQVTLAIYKDEEGNWRSSNGIANVRNVPVSISKTLEKMNLTLSAPPIFAKLENLDNPTIYLATWSNVLVNLREKHVELVRKMRKNGLISTDLNIGGVLEKGADKVASIAGEIKNSIETGTQYIRDKVISFIKAVVLPIVLGIVLLIGLWTGLKIYYGKHASRKALIEFAKVARKAPPMVRNAMRRMRPEINNIQLDDDEDEPTEMQVFETRRKYSETTIPEVYSILTVGGKSYLPYIPTHLNGIPAVGLMDTGSSVSLIAERVVARLGLTQKVKETACKAKVANGTQMEFVGKVWITVVIGDNTILQEFLVVRNGEAPAPCLLGIDFVTQLNKAGKLVTFKMTTRKVVIGNSVIDLLNPDQLGHEEEKGVSVVCAEDENIPPRSYAIIAGKIPEVMNDKETFITSDITRETDEIYSISNVLTTMNELGQVVLKIFNPGNSEIKLKGNMKIAQAEFFREKGIPQQPAVNSIEYTNKKIENEKEQARQEEAELLLKKLQLKDSNLSEEGKEKVKEIIRKYPEAFVGSDGRIGRFKGRTKHYIELNDDHKIPQTRPYRLNPEQKEKLEKELEQMRKNDLIEESASPYTSPLLMVPKPNGDTRIVIDYRKLNLITRPRTYIMPHTADVTEEASRGKIFSVFDICQGFHHIKMHEPHKERTAFCCHLGVFQYKFMPMGLKGSPDTFQRAMSEVSQKFSGTLILYVDDLIVVSDKEEQHLKDLEEFFNLMIQMGLKLKAEKSQIGRSKIKFLGFVIENGTIQPSGEKTEAIRAFPTPKNVTEVKSFLGMSGYFRKFIKSYAILARPLTMLTQKENVFKWGPEQEKALELIKEKLINPPILSTPNLNGEFEMHTDASKIGIAAVLLQKQDNELKVIAYGSRPTTKIEQRYPPIELEALAITWGLTHYRPYIFGRKVKVVTDHQPLKSLLHRKDKNMSSRLLRHEAIIQQYDVEIIYRPGRDNHVADALSRQNLTPTESETVAAVTETEKKEIWTFEDWKNAQNQSPYVSHIKKNLLDKKGNKKLKEKYCLIREVVHLRPKSRVEKPLILLDGEIPDLNEFILSAHKYIGHGAGEKTRYAISKIVAWNGMKQRIHEVVSKCKTCQMRKHPQENRFMIPMGKWDLPNRPFERIHIDVMGPFPETKAGNKYIIAAVDAFSRFAVVKATKNQTSDTTIKFLMENVVGIHGIPLQVVTDQGRNFTSHMFKEVSKILQMNHTLTPAYHHQSNGMIERFNRTIEEMLTCVAIKPQNFQDWDNKIPIVVHAYNAQMHVSTGFTPEYIIFGRSTIAPMDLLVESEQPKYTDEKDLVESITEGIKQCHQKVYKRIEIAQNVAKRTHDQKINPRAPKLKPGDKVVIRSFTTGKLENQYSQPATVVATTETTAIVRNHKGKIETVHKNRLKKFYEMDNEMEIDKEQEAEEMDNGGSKFIKKMVKQRLQMRDINGSVKLNKDHQLRGKDKQYQLRGNNGKDKQQQLRVNNGKDKQNQLRGNSGPADAEQDNQQIRRSRRIQGLNPCN